MLTRKRLLLIAAAALAGAGLVAAQGLRRGFGGGPAHRLQMLATVLDLTETQKEQAKAIFEAARQQAEPAVAQLRQGHEAMEAAVKAGRSDAELQQIADRQGAWMGQVAGAYAKGFAKFYAILTPEQKAKADKLHGEMKGAFASRWGPHGARPHL